VQAVNVKKGKKVKNVFMHMIKTNSQQTEESVTDKHGIANFKIREICSIIITSQKTGYANLSRTFEITQGLLASAVNNEIFLTVPMVKDKHKDQTKAFACLTWSGNNSQKNCFNLKALSCSGKEVKVKDVEKFNMQICKFDTKDMLQSGTLFEDSPSKKKDKNPALRFLVNVT
jgi:hypothetical protein